MTNATTNADNEYTKDPWGLIDECAADFIHKMTQAFGNIEKMAVILKPNDIFHSTTPSRWSIIIHTIVRIIGMASARIVILTDAMVPRINVANQENDMFVLISRHMSAVDVWLYFVDSGLLVMTNMCYMTNHSVFRAMFDDNYRHCHHSRMRFANGTLGPMVMATTISPASIFLYTQHEVAHKLSKSMIAHIRRLTSTSSSTKYTSSRPIFETASNNNSGIWRYIFGLIAPSALPIMSDIEAMELLFESTFGDMMHLACEI